MTRKLALLAAALASACTGGSSSPTYPDLDEPNDTPALAASIAIGTPVAATITTVVDFDVYRLEVPAGGATLRIRTFDRDGGACDPVNDTVDTYLQVVDAGGTPLLDCSGPAPTPCDDSGLNRCEDVTVSVPEGAAYVEVTGYGPYPMVYTLRVETL